MHALLLIDEEGGCEEIPSSGLDAAPASPSSPPSKPKLVPRSKSVGRRKLALDLSKARYLSMSDVARYAGMGRTTVWRLMKSGRLRFVRISPTLVRIPITELARLGRQPIAKLAEKEAE